MIKSICIETIFTEAPFEKRFELVKQSGFDYIEFWLWKDKNINKIKELREKNDLKVASFSGDQNYSLIDDNESEKYISFIKESIETAKYLKCNHLVIHSNALGPGGLVLKDYKEMSNYKKFGTMLNVLKKLSPIAKKEKITLVLEALNTEIDHAGNFLASTKVAAEAVQLVNSPYIKILYDVYHMQIMEGNIIATIKKYIDSIGYIHIADVPGRHEPGTGEINYNNIIKTLKTLNYNGIIGFELFPLNSSEDAIKIIKEM
ncbi:MAG: TIM barrel protein [Tepidanaerobacteraceae bacterium]|jgi:hydroxypyruvate isomerase|nr:TIM barrel protein [Tepidanaerobacteraceae bacterium]